MIVLYGASGYTGRLVVAELAALGADFAVAGRDRTRLREALAETGDDAEVEVRVADAGDPDALAAMLEGADVVVSTVGPFERLGMPVVDAAVAAGVAYCDSTGEPGFMRRVASRHGQAAVPVVPACGFDYVPHDLAAAVAADGMGRVDRLETLLAPRHFATSQGTKASTLGAMADPLEEWTDGAWGPARVGAHRRRFDLGPGRPSTAGVSYPGGDAVQIVNHVDAATVRPHIAVPGAVAPLAGPFASVARVVLGSSWVRDRVESLIRRGPEGPSPAARARNTWTVAAEATAGGRTQTSVATGADVYGLTGRLLAMFALRLRDWREAGIGPGFRAPAEIVEDPIEFASEAGFELERIR
ncbi:MAG: saccharopine dehydrogenase NADP-binding domain-containing protein [Acidimicrobiia bacterium]